MSSPLLLAATWTDGLFVGTADSLQQELAGQSLRGLASDGHGGALVIVGGRSLRRRSAHGVWTTLATAEVELACCMALGVGIFVGTDDARILRPGPDGALTQVTAFEAVTGRDSWYAGTAVVEGRLVGPPLGVRSLSATCDGRIMLANVHVGGIPRSVDNGATWAPTLDIEADVHEVRAHSTNPRLVIAAAAVGLCVSTDAGATWTVEHAGLHAPHCSAVAFVGNDIVISASEDPFSAQGAVYRRSIDGRGPLQRLGSGFPEWTAGRVDTGCLASQGSVAAAADAEGHLYWSGDAGRTWDTGRDVIPSPSGILLT